MIQFRLYEVLEQAKPTVIAIRSVAAGEGRVGK